MSLNRIVALFTPVFAAGAALATGYLSKHFPGLPVLEPAEVVALEITAATSASAAALKWLHGSQQIDRLESEADTAYRAIEAHAASAGIHLPDESELLEDAESEIAHLTAQLTEAIHGRSAAEIKLASINRAISHIRSDANLVVPDVSEVQPDAVAQPEDLVAATVTNAAISTQVPVPVVATVGNLTEATQSS